ncbi:unnamed protein product [Cylindrotheca closterium]|uniref:protein-tyrosine-phosphatase n=1 Tax=Cylindrotheca closterium TaxID=2856 RepID=A0AAD2G0Q2_9STRA|nr:unnamed protein product [Cylindrotheca closterium]
MNPPVIPLPDEIIPGLWLGSKHVRIDLKDYISTCFTHVVDASNRQLPELSSSIPVFHVKLTDSAFSQLPLEEVSDFIHSALKSDRHAVVAKDETQQHDTGVPTSITKKANVLVHCNQGVSRSAALVMAYLIKTHGFSLKEAFFHVQSKREVAQPNTGFMKQLIEFERTHHNGETTLYLGFGGTLQWKKG